MNVNADFTQRVLINTAQLAWQPSPMVGVDRRMLDRIGGEVARATSIVRYAPGSQFSPHVHAGGEEFIVLEGTFQDEHGDFPAGSYVRNPPTSQHTPGASEGCVIFVKLWQFAPEDRTQLCHDMHQLPRDTASEKCVSLPLFQDAHEEVVVQQWASNTALALAAPQGAEVLVLEGDLRLDQPVFGEQDMPRHGWLRLPVGDVLTARSGEQGVRLWIKRGHLAQIRLPTDGK